MSLNAAEYSIEFRSASMFLSFALPLNSCKAGAVEHVTANGIAYQWSPFLEFYQCETSAPKRYAVTWI